METRKDRRSETYRRRRSSHEDQPAKISSSLVAHSPSSIDQSTDTVRLKSGAAERGAVKGQSGGGLLRLEELLLAVGGLGPVVGVAEDGREDGERGGVGEDRAERDRGRLHGREVWRDEKEG